MRADVRKLQARGWLRRFGLYWMFVASTIRMAWGTGISHPQSSLHHCAALPACFSSTREGSAFRSSLLGLPAKLPSKSKTKSTDFSCVLKFSIWHQMLSHFRPRLDSFSLVVNWGRDGVAFSPNPADQCAPAECGFGVITVSFQTNFGFVSLSAIAFVFHKAFSKLCLMGLVLPFFFPQALISHSLCFQN